MLAGLKQAFYQERRRIYFVTLLAFVAGMLFYNHIDFQIAGLPGPFAIGLIYAGLIGFAATVICLVAPSFRFMLEAIALSRLAVATLAYYAPGVGDVIIADPLLMAVIVVGFGVGISRMIHGRISRHARLGIGERLRAYADNGRIAARVQGRGWQRAYVSFMDDAVAIPVQTGSMSPNAR